LAWLGISESQSQRPRPRLSTQGAPVSISHSYHCLRLVGFTILTFPLDLRRKTTVSKIQDLFHSHSPDSFLSLNSNNLSQTTLAVTVPQHWYASRIQCLASFFTLVSWHLQCHACRTAVCNSSVDFVSTPFTWHLQTQTLLSSLLARPLTFPPSPPLSCTKLYDFPLQPLAKLHKTRAHVAGCDFGPRD
jgi:hypothetical protein